MKDRFVKVMLVIIAGLLLCVALSFIGCSLQNAPKSDSSKSRAEQEVSKYLTKVGEFHYSLLEQKDVELLKWTTNNNSQIWVKYSGVTLEESKTFELNDADHRNEMELKKEFSLRCSSRQVLKIDGENRKLGPWVTCDSPLSITVTNFKGKEPEVDIDYNGFWHLKSNLYGMSFYEILPRMTERTLSSNPRPHEASLRRLLANDSFSPYQPERGIGSCDEAFRVKVLESNASNDLCYYGDNDLDRTSYGFKDVKRPCRKITCSETGNKKPKESQIPKELEDSK